MNAKQLLDSLQQFQREGVDLERLDVVTVYRPPTSSFVDMCIDAWEEIYCDEVDADEKNTELRLITF